MDAEHVWARLAAEVLANGSYDSIGEMIRAFVEQGSGWLAAFFDYRRRLGNWATEKAADAYTKRNSFG